MNNIEYVDNSGCVMAPRIADLIVVAKIESLAKKTGLTKIPAIEKAVDDLLEEKSVAQTGGAGDQFDTILAQIDLIPGNL